MTSSSLPVPISLLRDARDRFPGIWRALDSVLAQGGWWPPYIHLPSAKVAGLLAGGHRITPEIAAEVAFLAPLAAWRPTQGIYRFDPTLAAALDETDTDRDIPADILRALPEWCVWIDLDGREVLGCPMAGFFARLDRVGPHGVDELVLLLIDQDEALRDRPNQIYLPLVGSLVEAVERTGRLNAQYGNGPEPTPDEVDRHARELAPLVARVLYLCSDSPDLLDPRNPGRFPQRPSLKHRKKGRPPILPAAPVPTAWEIGYRIGAALRRAQDISEPSGRVLPDGRRAPIPHVRRAHWHLHWIGAHGSSERRRVLRWHSPTLVGLREPDELLPTVRPVKP